MPLRVSDIAEKIMLKFTRNVFLLITMVFLALASFFFYQTNHQAVLPTRCYTDFLKDVDSGDVAELEMTGPMLHVAKPDGNKYGNYSDHFLLT